MWLVDILNTERNMPLLDELIKLSTNELYKFHHPATISLSVFTKYGKYYCRSLRTRVLIESRNIARENHREKELQRVPSHAERQSRIKMSWHQSATDLHCHR